MRALLVFAFFAVALIGAALLVVPSPVSAQTTTTTTTATATATTPPAPGTPYVTLGQLPFRLNANGSTPPVRLPYAVQGTTATDIYINADDCANNREFEFTVTANVNGSTLSNGAPNVQAWSGSNCSNGGSALQTQTAGNPPSCWQAATNPQLNTSGNPQTVTVYARDIIGWWAATNAISVDSGTGSYPVGYVFPIPSTASDQGLSVCSSQSTWNSNSVTLYFLMVVQSGQYVYASSTGTVFPFSLVGPPPPTIDAGLPGEQISVIYSLNTNASYQSFNAYCAPPKGQENNPLYTTGNTVSVDCPGTDAGIPTGDAASLSDDGGDGSVDDATVPTTEEGGGCVQYASNNCSYLLSFLPAGSTPDASLYCGTLASIINATTGATQGTFSISNVNVGYYYAVALAGIDIFNNIGPLSNPVCVETVPTTDFWQLYKMEGGQAAGCSFTKPPPRSPIKPVAIALAAAAVAVGFIVRRRRRS